MPQMNCTNFFHSSELFKIMENTSLHKPYMIIAEDNSGHVIGHILAIMRRKGSLIPPYFFTQGQVYGEGEYADGVDAQELFGKMLHKITEIFTRRLCLYIEFSNIHEKMFGYKHFRKNDFFPITWQEIHNSLHSMAPEKRLTGKLKKYISRAYNHGIETREIKDDTELNAFYSILRHQYRGKINRFLPPEKQIRDIAKSENGKVFITIYKDKIIGGSACVYSEGNAFLWYIATKRKTFALLHPNTATTWHAISYAYKHNYAHIFFLDAGLPFMKNRHRDFILSFGGKPVTKYRWFHITMPLINRLLYRFFRD